MGAQASQVKLSNEFYTSIVAKTLVTMSRQCAANITQTQNLNIVNSGTAKIEGVELEQDSSLNLTCIQEIETNIDQQQILAEEIMEKIEQKLSGQNIGAQVINTESVTKSVQNLVAELNYTSITECLSSVSQEQNVNIVNTTSGDFYLSGISFRQSSQLVHKCLQSDTTTIKNISDVRRKVEREVKSSAEGFLTMGTIIAIVAGLFVVFLILGLVLYLKKSKGQVAAGAVGVPQGFDPNSNPSSRLADLSALASMASIPRRPIRPVTY